MCQISLQKKSLCARILSYAVIVYRYYTSFPSLIGEFDSRWPLNFKGRKMNPFDMMKNLGALQGQLKVAHDSLANIEVVGSSGGNMVRITMNGKFEVLDVKLDPICVDNRDVPMLEDLIKSAHQDALAKVQEKLKDVLPPLISGMNIQGMA